MPLTHAWTASNVARSIRAEFPDVGITWLSAHVESATAMGLLNGGERVGYLLTNRVSGVTELVTLRSE